MKEEQGEDDTSLRSYWTGLAHLGAEGFGRPRCCGAGWEAVLGAVPEGRWEPVAQGIFLRAKRWETAQRALEQVWISHHVLTTQPLDLYAFPHVRTETGDVVPEMEAMVGGAVRGEPIQMATTGFLSAALVAARASRSHDLDKALTLLGLSQALAATHVTDLDPSHWRYGPAVSPFPFDHARMAYSIIAAYAVLEQLGLEVRASAQRPSRRGATWDPAVRQDLEDRLKRRGIDLQDHAVWTARGTPGSLERGRPTKPTGSVSWAGGPIRDHEVAVVDAVADLSWLRSKIASHRMGQAVESLTLYDVSNAQYLARRFFLRSVGWSKGRGFG